MTRLLLRTAVFLLPFAWPLAAHPQTSQSSAARPIAAENVTAETDLGAPEQTLMRVMATWISFEFDLPRVDDLPDIAFAPAMRMAGLRYRDVPSDRWNGNPAETVVGGFRPEILAVYDDEAQTIYLPEAWTGETPADLSILVHEMVHHIQNLAGISYECPEAREALAFAAQENGLQCSAAT